jgi:hypothetical protein
MSLFIEKESSKVEDDMLDKIQIGVMFTRQHTQNIKLHVLQPVLSE